VIELAVSVIIAARRLPELIRPRRIFRDVGLLRAIAVVRQILLLTILKPFQPFNRSRSDRCLLRRFKDRSPIEALPVI
jgi:hypothetical protein